MHSICALTKSIVLYESRGLEINRTNEIDCLPVSLALLFVHAHTLLNEFLRLKIFLEI